MNDTRRVLAWMILVNVLWAPRNLFVKIALAEMSPVGLALVRWTGFALLLGACLAYPRFRDRTGFKRMEGREAWIAVAIGGLLFAPAHMLYYSAVGMTTSIEATALHTTMPMVTSLMAAVILREHGTPRRWGAVALSCAGAYIVSVGFGAPSMAGNAAGNLLYLLAVTVESLGIVLIAAVIRRSAGVSALMMQVLGMVAVFGLWGALKPTPWVADLSPAAWGSLAYIVLPSTLVTFTIWYTVAKRAPVGFLMITMGLQPVLASVLGAVVLREPIGPSFLAGCALVLGALAVAATERPKPDQG